MRVEPLPKHLYEALKAAGVDTLWLELSGGSDESYLNIQATADEREDSVMRVGLTDELTAEIESWVWQAYNYTGAGDGSDYGDDIKYDLKNGKVSHQEWYQVVHRDEEVEGA